MEAAWVGALAWFAPPLIDGELAIWIFVVGLMFVSAWGAIALAAYRRAVRRREAFGLSGADGGAADLLWLAPAVIAAMVVLWAVGGTLARPDATLTRFVRDWRTGDGADAASILVHPLPAGVVGDAWTRQLARLRNELVRLAAVGAPGDGIDPERPLDSVRFVYPPDGNGGAEGTAVASVTAGVQRVDVQVVRRESVEGSFFGLFPTTSQTLVPVADLGWIDLRLVDRPSGRAGVPDDPVWLIDGMDLLGERLGP